MKTMNKTTVIKDRKVLLSTIWLFAVFTNVYGDILTLYFNPVLQKQATQ